MRSYPRGKYTTVQNIRQADICPPTGIDPHTSLTAESTQDDDPPWRFRKIHIHYQVTGRGLDAEKVGKAIQLSEENYCSVYATLRDAIGITHDFEIVEANAV
jgi:uncharacterized OsmC-like protein